MLIERIMAVFAARFYGCNPEVYCPLNLTAEKVMSDTEHPRSLAYSLCHAGVSSDASSQPRGGEGGGAVRNRLDPVEAV
jgi:hypothetical protein